MQDVRGDHYVVFFSERAYACIFSFLGFDLEYARFKPGTLIP